MKNEDQIKNFVLNIALWQVKSDGFNNRLSLHIQDVIPNFVIEWLRVDDGALSFDGLKFDTERNMWIDNQNIKANEIPQEYLDKILEVLKGIDLFK
jgi:hypothetical protein